MSSAQGTRRRRAPAAARPRTPSDPIVEAKLTPPRARPEHLRRHGLNQLLEELTCRKLTVVAAPTGFGKTTALASWANASRAPVAWVSLDASDNDPTRFLTYLVTALGRAAPGVGTKSLRALHALGADPIRAAFPRLFDELSAVEEPIVLVLDDYHRIQSRVCHEAMALLLDQSPGTLRVVVSAQVDPPLRLGRLRAGGNLGEVRVDALRFSLPETDVLLNRSLGLGLDPESIELLEQRTEGWPAGLYLAALFLRGRDDPVASVSTFAGSHRHVVDYLGTEVVDAQPAAHRSFLLRTSILNRLSGPICDAVLDEHGSGARLAELSRSNLFLIALGDDGESYRYHRLFGELLQFLLRQETPELVPELHRRAAVWHESNGLLDEAVGHALAAGDPALAAELIVRSWRPLYQFGQHSTLRRLLGALPPAMVDLSAPLSFIAVLLDASAGASEGAVERRLALIERSGWEGPFPDGTPSTEVAAAFTRVMFLFGDVGRSLAAANRLGELAGDDFIFGPTAALGRSRALYLRGDLGAALEALPPFGRETAPVRPTMSAFAPALRSLILLEQGEHGEAATLAFEAVALAEELGVSEVPLLGIAFTALGCVLAARGEDAEAERQLERGLDLVSSPRDTLSRAFALIKLAPVRARRGDRVGARVLVAEARAIIDRSRDPGSLGSQLDDLDRQLSIRQRREIAAGDLPTESELRVLRMLSSGRSQQEIARALYVSTNTVKTHRRALYRKLRASTREEAVSRARTLGLL